METTLYRPKSIAAKKYKQTRDTEEFVGVEFIDKNGSKAAILLSEKSFREIFRFTELHDASKYDCCVWEDQKQLESTS